MRCDLRIPVLLLLLLAGCATNPAPSGSPAGGGRSGALAASVRAHLEFLASDALNGRASGTRDEQIAAEYVGAQFRRLGLASPEGSGGSFVQTIPFTRTRAGQTQSGTTYNAVGILQGTDASGEAILISAHLDHLGRRETVQGDDKIFNGADDDASGTVAVMELAEALARRGRPKRTVIFACFGSEESGGFGSGHLREKPPVPLEKIVAMIQFEMIGRPDDKIPAKTLWLTGYERSDLGPALAARGARLVQDPHPEQSFFTRSDNITFARRGVVAHTVSSYGLHKQYHTPADETSRVDYAHMVEAIDSMIKPLTWLANARFKPSWKPGMKPEPGR
jgi:Zn-dependent M28 family amino/carboxypeptidase